MIGVFHTTGYYFLLDDAQTPLDINSRRQFDDHDLGTRFLRSGQVPNIGSAPLASWFIARLAALTGGKLGLFDCEEQHVDGGSCCLEFLVFTSDQKFTGAMQIQAGEELVLFGWCATAEDPESIVGAFVGAFLALPTDVREISVRVRNPENKSRRVYGYDGSKYLGRVKPPPPQKSEAERVAELKQEFRSMETLVIRHMLTYRLQKEAEIAYREILQERGEHP
jgi:hypothetical protein